MKPKHSPLVQAFNMEPHIEGGWFKEVWKASNTIPHEALGGAYSGARAAASSTYFYFIPVNHLLGIQFYPTSCGCITQEVR